MQIIKISSLGCTSCIIINNILEKILENYKVHIKELDYDFDEFSYEVGTTLPVLIFVDENGKELLKREESGIDCGEMMLSPGYYDLTMRAEEKYEGVVYKTELMYRFTVD